MSNITIVDIDYSAFLDAAFPKETPEEAEFKRVFGRAPEPCDRQLGLARVLWTASLVSMVTEVQS